MNISSRPTHRKIRRSKLSTWRETKEQKMRKAKARWLRNNMASVCGEENIGRIFTASANERLAKASAEAKALKFELLDEVPSPAAKQKPRPPVTQPAPGTYAGRGGDPWVFAMLVILAITAFMIFLGYIATH